MGSGSGFQIWHDCVILINNTVLLITVQLYIFIFDLAQQEELTVHDPDPGVLTQQPWFNLLANYLPCGEADMSGKKG